MSTVLRGANSKGSYYGDASYRTAYLRKQAVLNGQRQKTGNTSFLQGDALFKKPLISEHHLTKGSDNGVRETYMIKNQDGIF
jgi:hypothetical protein